MGHPRCFIRLAAFLVLAVFSSGCAHRTNKDDFLHTAQSKYYSLTNNGVAELQFSVTPDWATLLSQELKAEIKPDNAGLKLLGGVHFSASVNETGRAKLTHQVDAYPQSTSGMDNLQKAIGGVEETLDGFWRTASVFLFTSPFPKSEIPYQLSEGEGNHLLSYRDGNYDIVTTITADYAITEIQVTSATLSSSLKPRFTITDAGFLLASYDADYKQGAAQPGHISVQISYQDIEKLHLPSDLVIETTSEGAAHEMRLHLGNYEIKRR